MAASLALSTTSERTGLPSQCSRDSRRPCGRRHEAQAATPLPLPPRAHTTCSPAQRTRRTHGRHAVHRRTSKAAEWGLYPIVGIVVVPSLDVAPLGRADGAVIHHVVGGHHALRGTLLGGGHCRGAGATTGAACPRRTVLQARFILRAAGAGAFLRTAHLAAVAAAPARWPTGGRARRAVIHLSVTGHLGRSGAGLRGIDDAGAAVLRDFGIAVAGTVLFVGFGRGLGGPRAAESGANATAASPPQPCNDALPSDLHLPCWEQGAPAFLGWGESASLQTNVLDAAREKRHHGASARFLSCTPGTQARCHPSGFCDHAHYNRYRSDRLRSPCTESRSARNSFVFRQSSCWKESADSTPGSVVSSRPSLKDDATHMEGAAFNVALKAWRHFPVGGNCVHDDPAFVAATHCAIRLRSDLSHFLTIPCRFSRPWWCDFLNPAPSFLAARGGVLEDHSYPPAA